MMSVDKFRDHSWQYAESRNYTSSSNWHTARVLVGLIGMQLDLQQSFFNPLTDLKNILISCGMPASCINTLAAC